MSTQLIFSKNKITRLGLIVPLVFSVSYVSYAAENQKNGERDIEIITVTANKKEQSLQDVAAAVTAISGDQLKELGLSKMEDVVLMTPSVTYQGNGQGGVAQIYIRGVSDGGNGNLGGAGPSAAMYLDDQPVTTTQSNPDIHAYDLARVEVLNGPQGTLYGASSQSGTIKMITNDANVEGFEAGVDIGYGNISGGSENTSLEFFVNMPLFDGKAALRVVGWDVEYGGYIDNTYSEMEYPAIDYATGESIKTNNSPEVMDDFNESSTSGFRTKLRYNFNDDWSMVLSSFYQSDERQGYWGRDLTKTGDETTLFTLPTGETEMTQYALSISGSFAFADLNFSAGKMSRDFYNHADWSIMPSATHARLTCENLAAPTTSYGAYIPGASDCGDPGGYLFDTDAEFDRTTYELRLTSNTESPLQYVVGLYSEELANNYGLFGQSPGKLTKYDHEWHRPKGIWESYNARVDTQKAVFGEVSYDLNDFTLTLGGRKFWSDVTIDIDTRPTGVFYAPTTGPIYTNFESEENGEFLKKINLSYRFTEDVLFYASQSEGYRAGGPNRAADPGIPSQYDADFLTSTEMGWRSRFADGLVTFNGAIFSMDWKDFQAATLDLEISNFGFTGNVGNASVKGAEMDITWYATRDLTLFGSIAHYDASIDTSYNQTSNLTVNKGARLPWSPDYKASLTANYYFELPYGWDGVTRLMTTYVGEKVTQLTSTQITDTDPNGTTDPYTMVNWNMGMSKDNWNVGLYVKNVFDEQTQTYISWNGFEFGHAPRTIGLSVGYQY
jgi:iron complex outermembrane receptor protein